MHWSPLLLDSDQWSQHSSGIWKNCCWRLWVRYPKNLTLYDLLIIDPFSDIDPKLYPVFIGAMRMICSLLAAFLLHKIEKKYAFITCAIVMGVANASIATVAYIHSVNEGRLVHQYVIHSMSPMLVLCRCWDFKVITMGALDRLHVCHCLSFIGCHNISLCAFKWKLPNRH